MKSRYHMQLLKLGYHDALFIVKTPTLINISISNSTAAYCAELTYASSKLFHEHPSQTLLPHIYIQMNYQFYSDRHVSFNLQLEESMEKLFTQEAEGLQQPFFPIVDPHPKLTPVP